MRERGATTAASGELAEVRALYETTQEICRRLDLDQALHAIVGRARNLLDADVAYLATTDDEAQALRMRAFDNIRSPAFRALVMDYGVGLGGAVAAKRGPIAVPNYQTDATLEHAGYIDTIVREEGLKAAVGVPVEFENRLLAILFVAKRRRTRFSAHQVTLLASLANSAAIAMNNAQMYAHLARAMGIHQKLMQIALSGQGVDAVAATLADLIDGPVLLLDWAGQLLAAAPDAPGVAVPAFSELPAPDRSAMEPAAFGEFECGGLRGQVITIDGQTEGYLLVKPQSDDRDLAGVAVQQAATVFALELARMRSAEQTEAQLRGDLLDELFQRPLPDETALARQARRLGVDLNAPHVVGVLRLPDSITTDPQNMWRRLTHLIRFGRDRYGPVTVIARGDRLVLLLRADSVRTAEAAARRIAADCRTAQLPAATIGLGRVCCEVADYLVSFQEASRAADAAARLPRLAPVASFAALEYHQLVLGARPPDELVVLAMASLEPLLAYDRDTHGGSLVRTLREYLASCGNAEATARALSVHPNTLRGRLARIEELTGRDLQSAAARLDLHLALATTDLAERPVP